MLKKFLLLAAVAASIFGCSGSDTVAADGDGHVASGVKKGTMTDSRDGQKYKTVTIGTQTWMAENLNYATDNSYCYDDGPAYCKKYGRLYMWETARHACPAGWHLPSANEWETLFKIMGNDATAMRATDWNKGTDAYGFTALPAGVYSDGFYDVGSHAYFWSATENYASYVYYWIMDASDATHSSSYKSDGLSVRCLQD